MDWDKINKFPAYICTIKGSDRTAFALEELKKVGVDNLKVIYGIDGGSLEGENAIKEKSKEYAINLKLFIRYGEVALALAFYEALLDFINNSKESHMLWFEDDVIAHYNSKELFLLLSKFTDWNNYDLIYLGTTIVNGNETVVDFLKSGIFWKDCSDSVVWGTQALLINRNCAQALISKISEYQAIDMYIHNVIKKSENLKSCGLLFPLLLESSTKTYDWDSLYRHTNDPRPEEFKHLRNTLGLYRRSFGAKNTCFGIFYQKNIDTILRKQPIHKKGVL